MEQINRVRIGIIVRRNPDGSFANEKTEIRPADGSEGGDEEIAEPAVKDVFLPLLTKRRKEAMRLDGG